MSSAPDSFERVLAPLIPHGYALAFTMLNDRQAAEDAVQEAAIKAWRRMADLRDPGAIRPWFLSIVCNECRTIRRSRWWSVITLSHAGPNTPPTESSELHMDLGRALDKLGRTDRSALYLHFYCDMTFEQVATVLGISMTAARSRIYRALDRLRRFLAPQGEFANGW